MNTPSSATQPSAPYGKVMRVLGITLALNLLISFGKLIVGMAVHSLSMIADGIHSLLDAAANVVGLVSVSAASMPADEDHPYGHQKFEVVASLVIAIFMGVACVEILEKAVGRFFSNTEALVPNTLSFAVMLGAMAISAWVSWFESKKGKELSSSILAADSAHTGTDTLSAGAVLAALVGARLGFAWVDWLASFLVVVIVARAAWSIVNKSLNVLADRAVLNPAQIASAARSVPGILGCNKVRSHGMLGHIHVDMHIQVDPALSIPQSHALTHQVIAVVKKAIPGVEEVFVHTEPAKPEDLEDGQRNHTSEYTI